jgi:hypothetical protein
MHSTTSFKSPLGDLGVRQQDVRLNGNLYKQPNDVDDAKFCIKAEQQLQYDNSCCDDNRFLIANNYFVHKLTTTASWRTTRRFRFRCYFFFFGRSAAFV